MFNYIYRYVLMNYVMSLHACGMYNIRIRMMDISEWIERGYLEFNYARPMYCHVIKPLIRIANVNELANKPIHLVIFRVKKEPSCLKIKGRYQVQH